MARCLDSEYFAGPQIRSPNQRVCCQSVRQPSCNTFWHCNVFSWFVSEPASAGGAFPEVGSGVSVCLDQGCCQFDIPARGRHIWPEPLGKGERWGEPGRGQPCRIQGWETPPATGKATENTGLLGKVEPTAWRKVLKCSEHSLKFTSGIKLPDQIGSQSPKHADLSLSLFLPVTN